MRGQPVGVLEGPRGVRGGVALALPELVTFFEPASWRNNRGKVDRSACLYLSVAEARRIGFGDGVEAARNRVGRLTTEVVAVDGEGLWALHRTRRPRELRGDYRWKAPAMRAVAVGAGATWQRANARGQDFKGRRTLKALRLRWADGPDFGCVPNPNRGAGAVKGLGLAKGWSQRLRVEVWENARIAAGDPRLPAPMRGRERVLVRPYLVCPGAARVRGLLLQGVGREEPTPGRRWASAAHCSGQLVMREEEAWAAVREPAGLSTRPRGGAGPTSGNRGRGCSQRASKLYLPLGTPAELADAAAAWAWLQRMHRDRLRGRVAMGVSELERAVVARYAELFPPRALLCAGCLGLRFGRVQRKQVPAEVASRFPKGKAPELPDPFARNRVGKQFASHDQKKVMLTKSELRNPRTRAAALGERAERAARPAVLEAEAARMRDWVEREKAARMPGWERVMEALEVEGGGS